jgi:endonuclease/exonuclease/phosphatase family metal-dependent hydrolase
MLRTKRKLILGVLALFLVIATYRVFAIYTVRSGECRPRPVQPGARRGMPPLQRPLVMMTYNIAGHDELIDGDHIRSISEAIRRVRPDIVALQEVHRGTWQARFNDQLAELEARTGLRGFFAPSYVRWGGAYGNAILTRGEIIHTEVHPLPCIGEPRALLEATVRIDGATIDVYVTHLTTWGRLNSKIRKEQLQCLAREVRASRYPFILAGDLNTGPDSPEMQAFRREKVARQATQGIGATFPRWHEQIDYIFVDPGWQVRAARTWPVDVSDHLPVTAELLWERRP